MAKAEYRPEQWWGRYQGDTHRYWEDRHADGLLYYPPEPVLKQVLGELEFQTVLDFGCGEGELAEKLFPVEGYLGVDFSLEAVGRGRRYRPNRRFEHWPCSLPDVDLVFTRAVLVCVKAEDLVGIVDQLLAHCRMALFAEMDLEGMAVVRWMFAHDYPALFGGRLIRQIPYALPKQPHKIIYQVRGALG